MHAQSNSALFRCKDQKNVVNLSINDSGKMVEGPTCAQIVVNALRYWADFGKGGELYRRSESAQYFSQAVESDAPRAVGGLSFPAGRVRGGFDSPLNYLIAEL